jgi:hypothetical protein
METIFSISFIAVLLVAIISVLKLKKENALLKRQLEKLITKEKNRLHEEYESNHKNI